MQNIRISKQEAGRLYASAEIAELGAMAIEHLEYYHDGLYRTYIVDRNINYTDICTCRCKFCAFSKSSGSRGGFVLPYNKIYEKISELRGIGGNQILMQGGLNPELTLDWHIRLLSQIKHDFPGLHIHAYSPPEIIFFAKQAGRSVENVTKMLCDAGLDTIPGGGAEILVDDVRKAVSPAKCSSYEWLDVMRTAHRLGVCTTATMMFGHLEEKEHRIEHLDRLRKLQDESLAAGRGYFMSFTAWPFQPGNSPLSKNIGLKTAGTIEYLRTIAISRIYLDNIKNIQSSWVTMGADTGQLSLVYGCNDLGSIMMEEKVVAAAGTAYSFSEEQLRQIITAAGFTPAKRDFYYRQTDQQSTIY
jgi:cyclic dehypoxanthinyl futalosine synthase